MVEASQSHSKTSDRHQQPSLDLNKKPTSQKVEAQRNSAHAISMSISDFSYGDSVHCSAHVADVDDESIEVMPGKFGANTTDPHDGVGTIHENQVDQNGPKQKLMTLDQYEGMDDDFESYLDEFEGEDQQDLQGLAAEGTDSDELILLPQQKEGVRQEEDTEEYLGGSGVESDDGSFTEIELEEPVEEESKAYPAFQTDAAKEKRQLSTDPPTNLGLKSGQSQSIEADYYLAATDGGGVVDGGGSCSVEDEVSQSVDFPNPHLSALTQQQRHQQSSLREDTIIEQEDKLIRIEAAQTIPESHGPSNLAAIVTQQPSLVSLDLLQEDSVASVKVVDTQSRGRSETRNSRSVNQSSSLKAKQALKVKQSFTVVPLAEEQHQHIRGQSTKQAASSNAKGSGLDNNSSKRRNFKRSSHKSVKHLSSQSKHDLLLSQQSRAEPSVKQATTEKSISYHQDQYSSHKVLISGKHLAMQLEQSSSNLAPQDQKFTAKGPPNKRVLSKQRKQKNLARGAQNTTANGTSQADQHQLSSRLVTQHQVQQVGGGSNVTSSLHYLFSNNPAAEKRSYSLGQGQQLMASQKQTKSKARMIRNIVQSSNLNTEKRLKTTASKQPQVQSLNSASVVLEAGNVGQECLLSPQSFEQLYDTPSTRETQDQMDGAFDDLFEGLIDEARQPEKPSQAFLKAELSFKRAQTQAKHLSQRTVLKTVFAKYEAQQGAILEAIKGMEHGLIARVSMVERRAQAEVDYARSRDHTRIWRSVSKLSVSWLSSLLLEAEKSRRFALHRTQKSFNQIIFTTQAFKEPQKVSTRSLVLSRKQSAPVVQELQSVQIKRDQFGDFQALEVLKYLCKLPPQHQFLVKFSPRAFTGAQQAHPFSTKLSSAESSINASVSDSAATAGTRKINVPLAVLDLVASDTVTNVVDLHPLAVLSSTQDYSKGPSIYSIGAKQTSLPSLRQVLSGCQDLLKKEQNLAVSPRQSHIPTQLVTNSILDVLSAGSQPREGDRYVYVCLKEAQTAQVEVPLHTEMTSKLTSNKALGRLYDQATPLVQVIKSQKQAACIKSKPIKGLNQLKVDFKSQSTLGQRTDFSILAQIDIAILKQTQEYNDLVSTPAAQSSQHRAAIFDQPGLTLYVIEQYRDQKVVRQLEPIEVMYLLVAHIGLKKPAKALDFVVNQADLAQWRNAKGLQGDNRNSLTIGSIQGDEAVAGESSRLNLESGVYVADDEVSHSCQYVLVDERAKEGNSLVRRYVIRATTHGREESTEDESCICVWPNCLRLTDREAMGVLVQALFEEMQNQAQQLQTLQPQVNAPPPQSTTTTTRKSRPESAYRQKTSNQSQAQAKEASSQGNQNLTTKRLSKLRIGLELDLYDNLYSRFIKKGKPVKEKGLSNAGSREATNQGMPSFTAAKTRSSFNAITNGSATAQTSQARPMQDASQLNPILATIQGDRNTQLQQQLTQSLSPFFARLCPFHQRLEVFLHRRFGISLLPNGPLNPNAFLKGLRVFAHWRSEAKNALINDLFQAKAGSGVTVMKDTMERIYAFACSQVARQSGPNLSGLIATLQSIPRQMAYPDKFFQWMEQFGQQLDPLMVKNSQFADAVAHYLFQLAPFQANLKQVKLNEAFIGVEITKWLSACTSSSGQEIGLNAQQVLFLRSNFSQLSKILSVADVIHRFTYFQQFINKLNALRRSQTPQTSDKEKEQRTPQQRQQSSTFQQHQKSLSQSQGAFKHHSQKQGQQTKATLTPYISAGNSGQAQSSTVYQQQTRSSSQQWNKLHSSQPPSTTSGPVKATVPSDGILFSSVTSVAQQQPQQVVPLNSLAGVTADTVALTMKQGGQQDQTPSLSLQGSSSLLKSSQALAGQGQVLGAHSPPGLLPNAGQAPQSTLDKITAIYGMQHRRTLKEQSQQPVGGAASHTTTPTNQSLMLASDGFLLKKKHSHKGALPNDLSIPRTSMTSAQLETAQINQRQAQNFLDEGERLSGLNSQGHKPLAQSRYESGKQNDQSDQLSRYQSARPHNLFRAGGVSGSRQVEQSFESRRVVTSHKSKQLGGENPHGLSEDHPSQTTAFNQAQAHVGYTTQPQPVQSSRVLQNTRSSSKTQASNNPYAASTTGQAKTHSGHQSKLTVEKRVLMKSAAQPHGGGGVHISKDRHSTANGGGRQTQAVQDGSPGGVGVKNNSIQQVSANLINFQPAQQNRSREQVKDQVNNLPSFQSYDARNSAGAREASQANNKSLPLTLQHGDMTDAPPLSFLHKQSRGAIEPTSVDPCSQLILPNKNKLLRAQNSSHFNQGVPKPPETLLNNQLSLLKPHPSSTTAASSKVLRATHKKQRAASAKKELLAAYAQSGPPNVTGSKPLIAKSSSSYAQPQSWQSHSRHGVPDLISENYQSTAEPILVKHNTAGSNAFQPRFSLLSVHQTKATSGTAAYQGEAHHGQPDIDQLGQNKTQGSNLRRFHSRETQPAWSQDPIAATAVVSANVTNNDQAVLQASTELDKPRAKLVKSQSKGSQFVRGNQHRNATTALTKSSEKQFLVAARYDSSVGFTQAHSSAGLTGFSAREPATGAQVKKGIPSSALPSGQAQKAAQQQSMVGPPAAPQRRLTGKKKAVPRPQLADSRVNYSSGMRIINSVLTPSNVPRSAAGAKSLTKSLAHNPLNPANTGSIAAPLQAPIRNITSAGASYAHSSKQQQINPVVQRTTKLNVRSGGGNFQQIDAQMSGGASSKQVTHHLINMQGKSEKANAASQNHHQMVQVTYANAMPRLASANAYLSKHQSTNQSRKQHQQLPSRLTGSHNTATALSKPPSNLDVDDSTAMAAGGRIGPRGSRGGVQSSYAMAMGLTPQSNATSGSVARGVVGPSNGPVVTVKQNSLFASGLGSFDEVKN